MPAEMPTTIRFYWTEDKMAVVSTAEFLERYRERFGEWRLNHEITDYDGDDFRDFMNDLIEEDNEIVHGFPEETDSYHSYGIELSRY